jgi:hypothetical protein
MKTERTRHKLLYRVLSNSQTTCSEYHTSYNCSHVRQSINAPALLSPADYLLNVPASLEVLDNNHFSPVQSSGACRLEVLRSPASHRHLLHIIHSTRAASATVIFTEESSSQSPHTTSILVSFLFLHNHHCYPLFPT